MSFLEPAVEYVRPWKLATLGVGLTFLLLGARYSGLPDWDYGVSVLMAACAYLSAAPCLRTWIQRRWTDLPQTLWWAWFTVDGSYTLYWLGVNPAALHFRPANALASLALFCACGLVWYPMAPLRVVVRYLRSPKP